MSEATFEPLTERERAALTWFRDVHCKSPRQLRRNGSSSWQEVLSVYWWEGRDETLGQYAPVLRQIRNQRGPQWLAQTGGDL